MHLHDYSDLISTYVMFYNEVFCVIPFRVQLKVKYLLNHRVMQDLMKLWITLIPISQVLIFSA